MSDMRLYNWNCIEKRNNLAREGVQVDCICNGRYGFYRDGTVEDECCSDDELCGRPFAEDRTTDQMYEIMGALR